MHRTSSLQSWYIDGSRQLINAIILKFLDLEDLIAKGKCYIKRKDCLFKYSTSEKFTGEYWLDGKKIYVKTLEINEQSQKHGLKNVSTIVGFEAFKYSSSTYGRIDVSKDITIQSESIYLTCPADYTIFLTIRFTKTTE